MADAIQRLRMLSEWDDWITFSAQGVGHREDSYHSGEIRMRGESIDPGVIIDVELIAEAAHVSASSLVQRNGTYELPDTTPHDAARILDAIFRNHLNIRPFADEANDYAVGAEW